MNPVQWSRVCVPCPALGWCWVAGQGSDAALAVSGGRTLRLSTAGAADEGRYTCVVTNAAGEARKDFHLSVLGEYLLGFGATQERGLYSRGEGILYTLLV